jgi:hypothetical protein
MGVKLKLDFIFLPHLNFSWHQNKLEWGKKMPSLISTPNWEPNTSLAFFVFVI